ncbi:MAG: hypothetical protein RIB43_12475 [Rhodospirillaceae bacterium]
MSAIQIGLSSLILVFFSSLVFAQENSDTATTQLVPAEVTLEVENEPSASSPADTSGNEQSNTEQLRFFFSEVMSLVYWITSAVFAAVLILVGYSSYFNIRVTSREQKAIREELIGIVEQASAELKSQNAELINAKLSDAIARIDTELEQIDKKISLHNKTVVSPKIEALEKSIAELELLNLVREAQNYAATGVLRNELMSWVRAAKLGAKINYWELDDYLSHIVRCLESGTEIYVGDVEQIEALLKTLGSQKNTVASRISELLKTVKIEPLTT